MRAVNTVNSQPRSASGSDWDALVQRICALICSDVSHDGIILGDLKDRCERSIYHSKSSSIYASPSPGFMRNSANA